MTFVFTLVCTASITFRPARSMAAAVFLGGPLGPVLPGPVWLVVKTLAVLALTILAGTVIARPTPSRMLSLLWVVLLPLSFVHLVISGVLAL